MNWPKHARRWTFAEIVADVRAATDEFRTRRLGEPKKTYLDAFAALDKANRRLTGSLSRLTERPADPEWVAEIVADDDLRTALRYVGAPPISEDDLKTLVGFSIASKNIRGNPDRATQICDIIVQILDPKRFPWIYEGRTPTKAEVSRARLASTVVATAQRVQTSRRADERSAVEGAVRGLLTGAGWTARSSPRSGIQNVRRDAPGHGEFMASAKLGSDEADFVVGLQDGRLLAIECKGSNSEINSRKRINKDVANNAQSWLTKFGHETIVPAAAIQGVFNARYVAETQEIPVVFFWSHRLEDLRCFLELAK